METATSTELAEREVTIIRGVVDVVPGEAAKEAHGHYSTLTARIAMEVLRHYKIKVRAVPCVALCVNKPFMSKLAEVGRNPKTRSELAEWRRENGSSAIGLFDPISVVTVMTHVGQDDEHDGVLVDTALDQFTAPQQGIVLHPLVATAPKGFIAGDQALLAQSGDVMVRYQRLDNEEWVHSEGWRNKDLRHHAIQRAIAKIDLKLHAGNLWDG